MEEIGVSDVLITTKESALLVKHSPDNWILDSGATLYICYNINLFDSLAPTFTRIVWGNVTNLLARGIGAVTIKLLNLARAILESVLYILELKLNLISLARLM